jgi:hypothetical protein
MEGQNQNDELYPIAVLIDELKVCVLKCIRDLYELKKS